MSLSNKKFSLPNTLIRLKHYLPGQSPLNAFVHHNTLHAFQNQPFFKGIRNAANLFGYRVTLPLEEFRALYKSKIISEQILNKIIKEHDANNFDYWKNLVLEKEFDATTPPLVGNLFPHWKERYGADMDADVHPLLYRILGSYLDQGVSLIEFPINDNGFLNSIILLEKNNLYSFFKSSRAKDILMQGICNIPYCLKLLVGNEDYYEQYLFDQQFAHQGWSGLIANIENAPETLLTPRKINLEEVIFLECLLEIDLLDSKYGTIWSPLCYDYPKPENDLFCELDKSDLNVVLELFQKAYEWTYYENVLAQISANSYTTKATKKSFQALFCLDDRECSLRRHIEHIDPNALTFGTPGFFNIEFYFKPHNKKSLVKQCPAPVTPQVVVVEKAPFGTRGINVYASRNSHTLLRGLLNTWIIGIPAAFKFIGNLINPNNDTLGSYSIKHIRSDAEIKYFSEGDFLNDYKIGFTLEEMVTRMESMLKSIGLIDNFSDLVYLFGHGSSSINNPHYSAYNCGACSGRPGSINARVAALILNRNDVRKELLAVGIEIPEATRFIGGLHDTTKDQFEYYDISDLSETHKEQHINNIQTFTQALDINAKERSRRFVTINTNGLASKVHNKMERRAHSLFEPRPELNHATNALCIIGRRELNANVFLDRRAFLNSYNCNLDSEGKHLLTILKAAAPVCGGINLEYYFSRVDPEKLGAGTKLPHNVVALIGVANGVDGDLRPGLPTQMTELHSPIRLLMLIEQRPDVVEKILTENPATAEWFINEWIILLVIHPDSKKIFKYCNSTFLEYNLTLSDKVAFNDNELYVNNHNDLKASTINI